MAVAFDAQSSKNKLAADTADPQDFTHTPVGTPRGILTLAAHGSNNTDSIDGVTYGGVACTRVRTDNDAAGEAGRTYAYWLGSSIPTGAQTVSWNLNANTGTRWLFVCVSVTASDDTEVIDHDGISGDAANPSVTLQYSSRTSLAVAILYSGAADATTFTENANCTSILEVDAGNFGFVGLRQTTAGSSDFAIGGTLASDDVAYSAFALTEVVAAVTLPPPGLIVNEAIKRSFSW